MRIARLLTLATVAAFPLAAFATGCGDDTNNNPTTKDGGGASLDGTTTDGTADSGSDGGSEASANTLYTRLGGHAGIRAAIDAIVAQELMDPDIASYFFNQTASPIPAGHPNADQISECFTDLLGNVAMGPEPYPTTVTDDAGSFTCRDMATIHKPLDISGGTFDKFVLIAAGELQTLGVAAADITAVGAALNGTKSIIVNATLADAGELSYPEAAADLAADAGTTTTLYERLGGHAGINAAITAIVGQELMDPEIASYFFNQTASPVPAGHPSAPEIIECFTDLLGGAAMGPETYPTTITLVTDAGADAGSFTCRDLTTIHTPLHISGGTFDKFVMIAAGELQTLGVASADITTIGGVLNSTKTAIVAPSLADAGELPYDASGE